jgi:TetR/AcrR family transcriptional regulator
VGGVATQIERLLNLRYVEHMLNVGDTASATDRRRSALVHAALIEFNEKGFHGASTRSITARAGMSTGLLFHYFPSKEALYAELVRLAFAHLGVDLSATTDPPGTVLRDAAERVLGVLADSPDAARVFVFMAYADLHPGVSAEADRMMREHDLLRGLVPVIEAGQQTGELRAGDPVALAAAFWSALQGVAALRAAQPDLPLPDPDWLTAIVRAEGAA